MKEFSSAHLITILKSVSHYEKSKKALLTKPSEVEFRRKRGLDESMLRNDIEKAQFIIKVIDKELIKRGIMK